MQRLACLLLVLALASLACGKYGAPVRPTRAQPAPAAVQEPAPAEEEEEPAAEPAP